MMKMKDLKILALSGAVLLCMASCTKPKEEPVLPDPVFPAHVEKNLAPGDVVELSFSANQAWELAIPQEQSAWFYFEDNGVTSYLLKGGEGSFSAQLHVVEIENNFDIKVCTPVMYMGSQKKEIARLTLMPEERTVAFFAAVLDEDGTFIYDSTGGYVYETTPATELHLTWPKGLSAYTLPVKVSSNVKWSVTAEHPAWMDFSQTSSSETDTDILLKGVAEHYPLESASGMINVMDISSLTPVMQLPVRIDGCKDIVRTRTDSDLIELNFLGQYNRNGSWTSDGSIAYLTSTLDSDMIVIENHSGELSYESESWVMLNRTFPGGEPTEEVVQDRIIRITASRNNSTARSAILMALPGYLMKQLDLKRDLFTPDALQIKEEYQKYIACTVLQAGNSGDSDDPALKFGVLAPVNTAYTMAVTGGGIYRMLDHELDYASLLAAYGTDEIYNVKYNNWYSSENLEIAISEEFDRVAFKPYWSEVEMDWDDCISYVQSQDQNLFRLNIDYFEEDYTTLVIFYKDQKAVAVAKCHLTENFWPRIKYNEIYFTILDTVPEGDDPEEYLPVGATLSELTSGEIYEKYREYDIPVWKIVYQTPESSYNAMIYVPPFPGDDTKSISIPESCKEWLKAEGGVNEFNKTYIHVKMLDKDPEAGRQAVVELRAAGRPLFVLVCERMY